MYPTEYRPGGMVGHWMKIEMKKSKHTMQIIPVVISNPATIRQPYTTLVTPWSYYVPRIYDLFLGWCV